MSSTESKRFPPFIGFSSRGAGRPAFSDLLHPDWTSGLQDAFRPNPSTFWAKAPDAARTLPTESQVQKEPTRGLPINGNTAGPFTERMFFPSLVPRRALSLSFAT